MKQTVGRDEPSVPQKAPPGREVERQTVEVGNTPAGFLDEQRPGGLIQIASR